MGSEMNRKKEDKPYALAGEFINAARALECDESAERFNATLGKISTQRQKSSDIPAEAAKLGQDSSDKDRDDKPE